jgi:uncharacterized protein (UPF0332 family)
MISPEDFFVQAETLAAQGDETAWRSAVSRGYYAAFHAARRLLRDLGFRVPGGPQAHAYLSQRLSNSGHPETAGAGSDLLHLRGRRAVADYDIHLSLSQPDAVAWVDMARRIIERLALAYTDPVRSQVIASIRAYETNVLRQPTYQGP